MDKMTTQALIRGAQTIEEITGQPVVAIQFEDGSGHNFNYQVGYDHNWKFISLREYYRKQEYLVKETRISLIKDKF